MALKLLCSLFLLSYSCHASLYFDGARRYAVMPDNHLLNSIGYGNWSSQVWFKVGPEVESYGMFFSNRRFAYDGFFHAWSTSYSMPYVQYVWNLWPDQKHVDCFDSEWHHSVVTKSDDWVRFYVDNVKVYERNWTKNYSIANDHALWIGFDDGRHSSSQFAGYLDEIAIWNKELSTEEIDYLYNNYLMDNPVMLADKSLIHYFPMNQLMDDFSQYIEDVANGHHAYLGDSPLGTNYDPSISFEEPLGSRKDFLDSHQLNTNSTSHLGYFRLIRRPDNDSNSTTKFIFVEGHPQPIINSIPVIQTNSWSTEEQLWIELIVFVCISCCSVFLLMRILLKLKKHKRDELRKELLKRSVRPDTVVSPSSGRRVMQPKSIASITTIPKSDCEGAQTC